MGKIGEFILALIEATVRNGSCTVYLLLFLSCVFTMIGLFYHGEYGLASLFIGGIVLLCLSIIADNQ